MGSVNSGRPVSQQRVFDGGPFDATELGDMLRGAPGTADVDTVIEVGGGDDGADEMKFCNWKKGNFLVFFC